MTEPTYEFVKGQGWVIQTFDRHIAMFEDGKRVSIEAREPNPGEAFVAGWSSTWCSSPGVYKIGKAVADCARSSYTHKSIADEHTVQYYNDCGERAGYKTGWLTFVLL